jgi:hypothetical protein
VPSVDAVGRTKLGHHTHATRRTRILWQQGVSAALRAAQMWSRPKSLLGPAKACALLCGATHPSRYTSFNFSALSVDTTGLPTDGAHGDTLENLTVTVKVTVSNTGSCAGSTPVMVAYVFSTHFRFDCLLAANCTLDNP